ncbi:uncharacterized protein P884DRAFT_81051 [Thermothelomyces heterothallicus CBS 202.75]|uniref:uncharacterized protein n=1 Tax=Thermothelomyces heterothallicus CBS 202.75 TaxID=1149848 RepID=UPI0037424B8A
MTPKLARPSICGLQAALSACRISTTSTTTMTTTATTTATVTTRTCTPAWRAFSTTPSISQSLAVPPESPKFITVPEPPQSAEHKLPPIRGHLPVPRDVFPKRDGNRKVKQEWIDAATPVSKAEAAGEPPKSEEEARRRVFAAARRKALASGITGLYVRKTQRQQRVQARAERRRKANLAAATAPERLDDVLTRPTVRASTALQTTVIPDPDRFAKAEAARERHRQETELKAEARRDALAQLYVAAQQFIIDEAELEARVEAIFTPDYHRVGGINRGQSIWDQDAAPVSVADLQAEMLGTSSKAIDANKPVAMKTTKRQKAVAEELTGGKL